MDETTTLNARGALQPTGFGGWLAFLWTFVCLMAIWHFTAVIGDGRALEIMFDSPANASIMRAVLWIKVWMWGPFLILAPLGHRLTRASALVAMLVVTLGTTAVRPDVAPAAQAPSSRADLVFLRPEDATHNGSNSEGREHP